MACSSTLLDFVFRFVAFDMTATMSEEPMIEGEESMKHHTGNFRRLLIGCINALVFSAALAGVAGAESYVAGQIGLVSPSSLSDGKVTQDGIGGLELSDQPLKNSLGLGAKFGHYFSRARWLGIETGLSYSTPHIKAGALRFTGPGGSQTVPNLPGVHQRMITWDADVIFRLPGYRFQPYVGIGPSVYFASLKGSPNLPGQSGTSFLGFNAGGGLRYYITRNWAVYGEGKYNWARISYSSNHSDPTADPFAFRATYSAITLGVGVSYHF